VISVQGIVTSMLCLATTMESQHIEITQPFLGQALSYRDLEEMMAERKVDFDYSTLYR
jgi:transposase-like protein